ncbi:MAG: transglycosylase SLT domain-containing protein [Brevinematia bacterium]
MKKLFLFLFCYVFVVISLAHTKGYKEYYSEFSFRNCVVSLLDNTNLTEIDFYILANSYNQMKDYSNAGVFFSKITNNPFKNELLRDFFLYGYFDYIKKTMVFEKFPIKDYLFLSNFLKNYSNSIFYKEMEETYLALLWKGGYFERILSINTENKIYPLIANLILTNLNVLDNNRLETSHIQYLVNYFDLIDSKVIEKFSQKNLEDIIFYLLNRNKYSEAKKMLELYLYRYGNYDFYNRNIAYLSYKTGEKIEAINYLEKYVRNGRMVSWKSFQTLLDILLREGYVDRAYELIKRYKDFYAPVSYAYWIKISKKSDKYQELFDWFKRISKRVELLPEQKKEIFRVLLRNDMSLAVRMLSLTSVDEKNYYYLYVSALIDYHNDRKKSAYKKFLEIVLNYPFTYEWMISLKYERELREKNYEWFRLKLRKKIASLREKSSFSKNDCLFVTSLDFVELPLSDKVKAKLKRKSKEPILELKRELKERLKTANAEFKKFFELESSIPDFMSFERVLLIDKIIGSKKNLLFYNNYDFLKNKGLSDFSVPTLNSYFVSFLDGRENLFLLDKEELVKVFPTNYLVDIEAVAGNLTNSILALSLLREESHFKKDAISPAGAIGVAQLMPATFNILKEQLKVEANIYDFQDNFKLGLIHFDYLLKRYNNRVYAFAAYNSGEANVNRWIKRYRLPDELWVECIEYNETYYYVRKILFSYFMYSYLLSDRITNL